MSVLTATVTLGTGSVTVTPQTGVPTTVYKDSVSSVQVFKSVLEPYTNLPSSITNTVFPPGAPVNAINTDTTQWYVRIVLNDFSYIDIPMGRVPAQATWVNTQAGAAIAEGAISTALNA